MSISEGMTTYRWFSPMTAEESFTGHAGHQIEVDATSDITADEAY